MNETSDLSLRGKPSGLAII